MSDHSISRLMWKEYRAQRSLWLALLGGTVLLQSLYFTFSEETRRFASGYPLAICWVVTVCYAIASMAVLFAGEREEGTDRFLQQLPLSPRALAIGKLGFSLLATLLFGLLAGGTGILIQSLSGTPLHSVGAIPRSPLFVLAMGLSLMLLVSLLTRGVMLAIAVAAAAVFVIVGGLSAVFERETDWLARAVMVAVAVSATVASGFQLPRWLRGKTLLPWGGATTTTEAINAKDRSAGNALRARFASALTLGGLLRRGAELAIPGGRRFAVLIWRELRTALPFLALWGGLGLIALLLRPVLGLSGVHLIYLLLTPLVCGLMMFAGDQQKRTMRFLADRGISPTTVWLSKQLVWLTTATLLLCVMLSIDHLTRGLVDVPHSRFNQANSFWEILRSSLFSLWLRDVPAVQVFQLAAAMFLTLFGIGQLFSCWIRRGVLAWALGLVCGVVALFWTLGLLGLGVPLWVSTWPLAICSFLATYRLFEGWLTEKQGWRRLGRQLAWIAVPVIAVTIAARQNHAHGVPYVEPGFDWRSHQALMANPNPELTRELRELNASLKFLSQPGDAAERITDAMHRVRNLAGQLDSSSNRTVSFDAMLESNLFGGLHSLAIWVSQNLDSRPLDESWEDIRSLIRVAGLLSENSVVGYPELTQRTLRTGIDLAVRSWARDPRQAPERLAKAIQFYESPEARLGDTDRVWKNRYVLTRQILENRAGENHRIEEAVSPLLGRWNVFPFSWLLRADTQRALAIANLVVRAKIAPDLAGLPPAAVIQPFQYRMGRSQLELNDGAFYYWLLTTPINRTSPGGVIVTAQDVFQWDQLLDAPKLAESSLRGTQLILHLERSRLENGSYPDRLDQLLGDNFKQLPRDPFSGGDFHYAPDGYSVPVLISTGSGWSEIPAGQPLLWGTGERSKGLKFTAPLPLDVPLKDKDAESAAIFRRRYPAGAYLPSSSRVPPDLYHNQFIVVPKTDRVRLESLDRQWSEYPSGKPVDEPE